MSSYQNDKRIDQINKLIIELASGNYGFSGVPSENMDDLDAIILGINMLGEELQTTTVSRDYLERIFSGVVDMLLVLTPDHKIQKVNQTVCSVLGYSEEQLIGKPLTALFSQEEAGHLEAISDQLEEHGFIYNVEDHFKTSNGSNIPVSFSCSLLMDNQKKTTGILIIAKDISLIKKTESDLMTKNEELNTFVYKASHDLRSPISSIKGLIRLGIDQQEDLSTLQDYMGLIEQSINRLDSILIDLLQFTRITQSHLELSEVRFKELVDDIIDSMNKSEGYSDAKFEYEFDDDTVFYGDRELFRSVFQNLIDNAVKYRDVKRNLQVKLKIEIVDNALKIIITDNGIGMDQQVSENIFKMFYRGHLESKGSGLGLYIVNTSINKMQGNIEVSSTPGVGSEFVISIPAISA